MGKRARKKKGYIPYISVMLIIGTAYLFWMAYQLLFTDVACVDVAVAKLSIIIFPICSGFGPVAASVVLILIGLVMCAFTYMALRNKW